MLAPWVREDTSSTRPSLDSHCPPPGIPARYLEDPLQEAGLETSLGPQVCVRRTGAFPVSVGGFPNIRSIWAVLQQLKWFPGVPGPLPASSHLRIAINDPTSSTFFRSQKQDGTFRCPFSERAGQRMEGLLAPSERSALGGWMRNPQILDSELNASVLKFGWTHSPDSAVREPQTLGAVGAPLPHRGY